MTIATLWSFVMGVSFAINAFLILIIAGIIFAMIAKAKSEPENDETEILKSYMREGLEEALRQGTRLRNQRVEKNVEEE